MAVTIRIPTTMRPISGGSSSVQVEGVTLADVLANLDVAHPGFHAAFAHRRQTLQKNLRGALPDDA